MFNLIKLKTVLRLTSYSTARPTVILKTNPETGTGIENSQLLEDVKPVGKIQTKSSGLVAAVFASLQNDKLEINTRIKPNFTDRKILKANTAEDLLSIVADTSLSKSQALKMMSILAEWNTLKKIDIFSYENDPRFIRLCRIMSRMHKLKFSERPVSKGDLSTVLGITGDDEAARLIGSITLPQMIKVMSSLAQKKRRSTPLLRSLAYNICRNSTKLNLKECADILYSMAVLNFPDLMLLERVANDAIECLDSTLGKSAVVGSLLTSFGLLRYKDTSILDVCSEWILKYSNICRPQDIAALFQTLAVVNHQPANLENLCNVLIPQLSIADAGKNSTWLDLIWSLVVLNQATTQHVASVLSSEFVSNLTNPNSSMSSKIKLLNINAAAKLLIPHYNGPLLEETSDILSTKILRTVEKQGLVTSILDSLGNLLSSASLNRDINSGMGFLIDGEFMIDKKCNPVPAAQAQQSTDHIRVAVLALDYYDLCRGSNQPHGGNELAKRLLEAQGYKVLTVPFTDFNPHDKIVQRVQYLEKQLKLIASTA